MAIVEQYSLSLNSVTVISGESGIIIPYLGGINSEPPAGWLYCDGSEPLKSQYPNLATAIAGKYGAATDPVNNFKLPSTMRIMKAASSASVGLFAPMHQHPIVNSTINSNLEGSSHNTHTFNDPSDTGNYLSGGHSHDYTFATALYYSSEPPNNYVISRAGGNANIHATGNHKHELTTVSITDAPNHVHTGNAGTVYGTNAHNHTSSSIPTKVSQTSSDEDYPPYVLIWHIIKI